MPLHKPTYEELLLKVDYLEKIVARYETIEKEKTDINQRSAAQLATLLENTEDYIMIADEKGFPRLFNSAYAEIIKKTLNIEMKPGIKPHTLVKNSAASEYWDDLHRRALNGERFRACFSYQ